MQFELNRYLGKWYLQYHIPQWFDPPGERNTTAEYSLLPDGTVQVLNTTLVDDMVIEMVGKAELLEEGCLQVNFPGTPAKEGCNYIIQYLLVDDLTGNYEMSIVTDRERHALWLLSREKKISTNDKLSALRLASKLADLSLLVKIEQK